MSAGGGSHTSTEETKRKYNLKRNRMSRRKSRWRRRRRRTFNFHSRKYSSRLVSQNVGDSVMV